MDKQGVARKEVDKLVNANDDRSVAICFNNVTDCFVALRLRLLLELSVTKQRQVIERLQFSFSLFLLLLPAAGTVSTSKT